MKRESIEQMLSQIDERYITETMDQEDAGKKQSAVVYRVKKWAVAAVFGILILGTGITVTATASDAFRSWLTNIFGGHEITKVEIEPIETPVENRVADYPADENSHFSLSENMQIVGETESFVCQYHIDEEYAIVDQIYSIQDNGLEKLPTKRFQGTYDGKEFSFEYAVINNEIFDFNRTGTINQVFHYTDGEMAYAELCVISEDTIEKDCIARLNLKTGAVEKLTNDNTGGNMKMSPAGKVILINYRAECYWTVLDIASRTEKGIDEINGYAHPHEIIFQDDYHVLVYGDEYEKGGSIMTGTKVIDLKTGKRTATYKECGNYEPQWIFELKKKRLTIRHVDGTTKIQIDGVKHVPHIISSRGDYALLGNPQEPNTPFYLCNMKEKTYMTIEPPAGLNENVEIYLAAKENKILLTDGKEAYLVDVSDLE